MKLRQKRLETNCNFDNCIIGIDQWMGWEYCIGKHDQSFHCFDQYHTHKRSHQIVGIR